ncbi:hypothetical protein [Piscirickettsia salmonis]|uniref:hypothetical protein n=1 Tax=Piscirickettsia salmonis TaxID=1238 RepID=UPI0012B7F7F7|nr:hypothetical protein [Piscirickettsia salmonis]
MPCTPWLAAGVMALLSCLKKLNKLKKRGGKIKPHAPLRLIFFHSKPLINY